MKKIILLLILLFPTFVFGQNYVGNYRAIFYNLSSQPITIIAEFEVRADSSIIANIKVGDEIKVLNGFVDKNGKFEVSSPAEGKTIYRLKGKFDKANKISFIRRIEERSSGSKSVSESSLEGNFAKFEKTVETKPITPATDGKNKLSVEQSTAFFGNDWTDFTAKLITKKGDTVDTFNLELASDFAEGERKLSVVLPIFSNKQKVWKSTELTWVIYNEKTKPIYKRNWFSSTFEDYNKNTGLQGGQIEIIGDNETQTIFKLSNLKVKRVGKDDFVEINGLIYADKVK